MKKTLKFSPKSEPAEVTAHLEIRALSCEHWLMEEILFADKNLIQWSAWVPNSNLER